MSKPDPAAQPLHDSNPVQDAALPPRQPVPPPAQVARRLLHESVMGIAGCLSNVLPLIQSYASSFDKESWASHGLMWLDQHWLDLDKPLVGDDPSGRSKAWRTTLLELRKHLEVARKLWEQDTAGPDSRLSLDFARVSKGIVACGLLTDATHHGLLIALAKAILDPRAPGAVPQYALAALGSESTDPQTLSDVVRCRTVRDLESRPWWRIMELALDQEYANVLGLPSLGNHEPTAVQAPARAPSPHPPGQRDGSNTQQFQHLMECDGPTAKPSAPPAAPQSSDTEVTFSAIERAIALLRRDGEHPRSVRAYARDVGVCHTTLGRNKIWRLAWSYSQEVNGKSRAELPQGTKDREGNLDAWQAEVCENCRQEEIAQTVTVKGEVVRVCEACAKKLITHPRTTPRTI